MLKRRSSLVPRLVALLAPGLAGSTLALLSACGQKGPLMLAAPRPAASSALPSEAPHLPLLTTPAR